MNMISRALLAVLTSSMLLSGCATFEGPGPLQIGSTPAPGTRSARLSWNGERETEAPQQAIKFDWPVDEARMTRGFLAAQRRAHWGLDLANKRGTPILSAERGTVIYTGNAFRGYGKLIVIEHNDEWATLYSHLDKITVKEGQVVARGDQIGLMGRTGRATGVHLHFEVRHHRQPVNPLAFLPQTPGLSDLAHLPGAGSIINLRQTQQTNYRSR